MVKKAYCVYLMYEVSMKKIFFLLINLLIGFVILSCHQNLNHDDFKNDSYKVKTLSLACWNAQTFFDAEFDGTEYSDFSNSSKWTKEKYLARLSRLCQVMQALNADIIVLEEIENAAVVQDIANQFAGKSWNPSKNWSYAAFAKNTDSAFGCAVFSRYKLGELKVHSMKIDCQNLKQPGTRPILQVTAFIEGHELVIFANHWKSKSGGAEESEIWRDWQEAVLTESLSRLQHEKGVVDCIICGDFNRDAKDFICIFDGKEKSANTVFRGLADRVKVYSPWFTPSGFYETKTGSYFYHDEWERIDNIFVTGNIQISSFTPVAESPWADSNSIPKVYKVYTGEGYSDHLPLFCLVTLS